MKSGSNLEKILSEGKFAVTGNQVVESPVETGYTPEPAAHEEEEPVQTQAEKEHALPGFSLCVVVSVLLIAVNILQKKK